jgi:hypothetical protein
MLIAIEEVEYYYYLRLVYSNPKNFTGNTIELKSQGLCKGNGTAQAGYTVTSIAIMGSDKMIGQGRYFMCPISYLSGNLSVVLFVNNTCITHMKPRENQSVSEAHPALQKSVHN